MSPMLTWAMALYLKLNGFSTNRVTLYSSSYFPVVPRQAFHGTATFFALNQNASDDIALSSRKNN